MIHLKLTFFAERDGLLVQEVGGLRGERGVEGDEVTPAHTGAAHKHFIQR
jgi:hypothetical protein